MASGLRLTLKGLLDIAGRTVSSKTSLYSCKREETKGSSSLGTTGCSEEA